MSKADALDLATTTRAQVLVSALLGTSFILATPPPRFRKRPESICCCSSVFFPTRVLAGEAVEVEAKTTHEIGKGHWNAVFGSSLHVACDQEGHLHLFHLCPSRIMTAHSKRKSTTYPCAHLVTKRTFQTVLSVFLFFFLFSFFLRCRAPSWTLRVAFFTAISFCWRWSSWRLTLPS